MGADCPLCNWNWDGASGVRRPTARGVELLKKRMSRIAVIAAGPHGKKLKEFLREELSGKLRD